MLPARLDRGLLRLLVVISAVALAALVFNPELPILLAPALVAAAITAAISYRRNHSETWWRASATIFVVASTLTFAEVFYLAVQK